MELYQRLKNNETPLIFSIQTHFARKLLNLTSHQETLTGERQCDELSFKGSLVAEQNLGPEL